MVRAAVDGMARKAAVLRQLHRLPDGPIWFVSVSGFTDAARNSAAQLGFYTSDLRDLEALRTALTACRD